LWNNLEKNYREKLALLKERARLENQTEFLRKIPLLPMTKMGWIEKKADKVDQLHEVLSFFRISTVEAWEAIWGRNLENRVAFRKAVANKSNLFSLSAWLNKGESEWGRLRFVTKFAHVDHLLDARHNGRTRFRFSMNDDFIIRNFEPGTSGQEERMDAACKVGEASYPLGFVIAPIYLHDGWKEGYKQMFEKLESVLPAASKLGLTFELIQHRFTKPAKNVIEKNYPMTKLELYETKRKWKWGRYGIGKYVYVDQEQEEIKQTLGGYIGRYFPDAKIEYFT